MGDTALAQAFEKAGYTDPLDQLAMEAWRKWSMQTGGMKRREYVQCHLDDKLTLALLRRFKSQVLTQILAESIGRLLVEAEDKIRYAAKAAGGGQPPRDTHSPSAPAKWSKTDIVDTGANPVNDRGQRMNDIQVPLAPVVPSRDAGESQRGEGANACARSRSAAPPASITRMADRQAQRMQSRIATEARLSKLDTVLIDGKKIGDCTVSEVREWAKQRMADARAFKRDAMFALNLTANLEGRVIIRDAWKPDDADQIYQRAEADNAA